MKRDDRRRRTVFLSFQFLTTSLIGSLVVSLTYVFGTLDAQLAVTGTMVSLLGGLFASYLGQEEVRENRRENLLSRLRIPIALADSPRLFEIYSQFGEKLAAISTQDDEILREFALLKLTSIDRQLEQLSRGEVVFSTTESWRTVYEQVLSSQELGTYRSIAWVKSPTYWQDVPGQKSMELNFRRIRDGLPIERIVIVRETLWPENEGLAEGVREWLEHQQKNGVTVSVARESALTREPDLKVDCGIYGDRAVGVQELDENSRTVRFSLYFEESIVRLFDDRWDRLKLYAEDLNVLKNQ